jgi:pimeloyl-ACP methyl ester carboxylesterase
MHLSESPARFVAGLGACLLGSCGTVLPPAEQAAAELKGNTLASADVLLKTAGRHTANHEAATVYQMRAAEIAWSALDTDGGDIKDVRQLSETQQHALRIIATATEGVAGNFIGAKYQPEKQFSHAGYSYRVSAAIAPRPGVYPLARLESAQPAREVKRTLCRNWHVEEGVGAPFSPVWKRPEDPQVQRFVSSRSYLEPITGVLEFDGPAKPGAPRRASLTGYDPTAVSRVNLGRTGYPLAADFTAPIVAQTADIKEFKIALTGLIHPGALDSKLMLLEPYDPGRIPVLLVHGLNSHPRMWRDVINDLRADPKLRGRYQFMIFYYPTGWPITYSSMRLREELGAFDSLFKHSKKMVMVGHSMGGLLSRMQVISPERKLWNARFGKDADKLDAKLPPNHLTKRMALFSANPDIGRQIYISTPHRGSGLADLSLTSWFVKILSLPTTITSALIDLPSNLVSQGTLNSVSGLSPANPLYQQLDQIPIQVPHHSIIGDRGRGNTPDSSDGVVPYWSSHLGTAQSEKIVPDGHGAYDDPQALLELRRILLLNAGIKD